MVMREKGQIRKREEIQKVVVSWKTVIHEGGNDFRTDGAERVSEMMAEKNPLDLLSDCSEKQKQSHLDITGSREIGS